MRLPSSFNTVGAHTVDTEESLKGGAGTEGVGGMVPTHRAEGVPCLHIITPTQFLRDSSDEAIFNLVEMPFTYCGLQR